MQTYNIYSLEGQLLTTITVHGVGGQAVVNALVELGYNPLLVVWKRLVLT